LAHTPSNQRRKIQQRIKQEKAEVYQELFLIVQNLEEQFLHPFEKLMERQCPKSHPNLRQQWMAQYFLALISLIMECFTIFNDTRSKTADSASLSDKAQRQIILEIAASQDENRYYRWSMTLFLQKQAGSSREKLDALLCELNHMHMMTELLDKLGSMVLENKILLLEKNFQTTLMDTLKKIREAYRQLNLRLNTIEDAMNQDESIQRNEKRILQPMLDDVEMTLETIQKSIAQVSEIINHPLFSEKQQQAIAKQMQDVQNQFRSIFGSDIHLSTLPMLRVQNLGAQENLSAEKQACIKLIEICYQEMSTLSKYHPKGQSLIELKKNVQSTCIYTKTELKRDFLKLIEISSSPRANYFFQAAYGQTRSAKALIKSLLDPAFKLRKPFLELLFEPEFKDLNHLSETELIERLNQLQAQYQWPRLAPELN
jgi:hypothetical protein